MVTKENIETRILTILKDFDIEESIVLNSDFVKNLGLDSLDVVELIMSIEKDFNITITDDEAEKINTLEDAVKLVYDKLTTAIRQ